MRLLCSQANLTGLATFVQGIQAGAYIAFGAFLACTVAGTIPGVAAANPGLAKLLFALVFPVGLALVTNCGAELYTGNTMMLTVAVLEKKATFSQLVKNWVVSYAGEHRSACTTHSCMCGSRALDRICTPFTLPHTSMCCS